MVEMYLRRRSGVARSEYYPHHFTPLHRRLPVDTSAEVRFCARKNRCSGNRSQTKKSTSATPEVDFGFGDKPPPETLFVYQLFSDKVSMASAQAITLFSSITDSIANVRARIETLSTQIDAMVKKLEVGHVTHAHDFNLVNLALRGLVRKLREAEVLEESDESIEAAQRVEDWPSTPPMSPNTDRKTPGAPTKKRKVQEEDPDVQIMN